MMNLQKIINRFDRLYLTNEEKIMVILNILLSFILIFVFIFTPIYFSTKINQMQSKNINWHFDRIHE